MLTKSDLILLRKNAGLTQLQMSGYMGLSLRQYQAIENNSDENLNPRIKRLLEYASLTISVDLGRKELLFTHIRQVIGMYIMMTQKIPEDGK